MIVAILLFPGASSGGILAKESYLIIAVWSILGFLVFDFVFRADRDSKFGKSLIVWIALLCLIFFTSIMWVFERSRAIAEDVETNLDRSSSRRWTRTATPSTTKTNAP